MATPAITSASTSANSRSSTATATALPFTPIIFCGPGANLYPLCDPQARFSASPEAGGASGGGANDTGEPAAQGDSAAIGANPTAAAGTGTSAARSGIKALLPIGNRPAISFPLQTLFSCGFNYAVVFAAKEAHPAIASALKTCYLQPPSSSSSSSAAAAGSSSTSNIVVREWNHNSPPFPTAAVENAEGQNTFYVELFPLGPYDGRTSSSKGSRPNKLQSQKGSRLQEDGAEKGIHFSRRSGAGTAQLLLWLHQLGRLQTDPLILPCDLLSSSLPLSTFLTSHYRSSFPHGSPTVSLLLYERGAGEGTGREREKEAPARSIYAYQKSTALPLSSASSSSSAMNPILPHTHHSLLVVRDEDALLGDDIDLRMSMFWARLRITLSTNLLDSHVYILDRQSVIPLLQARPELTSLREHVVPTIAKCSWQKGLREKIGWPKRMISDGGRGAAHIDDDDALEEKEGRGEGPSMLAAYLRSTSVVNHSALPQLSDFTSHQANSGKAPPNASSANKSSIVAEKQPPRPSASRHISQIMFANAAQADEEEQRILQSEPPISCIAMVAKLRPNNAILAAAKAGEGDHAAKSSMDASSKQEGFIARANTLPTYLECNRHLLRILSGDAQGAPLPISFGSNINTPIPAGKGASAAGPSTPSGIDPKAQISADSLVGHGTSIAERTTVKRSIIGKNAVIGRNAKIQGCIIMDGCTVGEGAKLENCVLCAGSVIGERCSFKDCDVGPNCQVAADTNTKNEKFAADFDEDDGI